MRIQFQLVVLALSVAMAAAASAQTYKWVDKDGKVRYGDSPPPGAKVTTLKPASPGAAAPAEAGKDAAKEGAKDAKKGPLTPTEQEQAFRKRKLEQEAASKKEAEALASEQGRRQNCERAQENARQIQSGQRIGRTDAKGERYYIEDDERAKELQAAQKAVGEWCK